MALIVVLSGVLPTRHAGAGQPTPAPRSFTLAATGDIVPDNSVLAVAGRLGKRSGTRYDLTSLFAPATSLISSADLAICHMETPVGLPLQRPGHYGREGSRGWRMLAPFETVRAVVATGYDRCSTASNHSWDRGKAGIASTLSALDGAGVTHTGTARTPVEASPGILRINGVLVAHIAYTVTSNTRLPSDPSLVSWGGMDRVVGEVNALRADGAEVVVLSLHGGKEGASAPSRAQRQWVDELTKRARVDLIVMHGPHTVEPVEQVNGTWVFWSVGNFISGMGPGAPGIYGSPRMLDGLVAWARFDEDPNRRGHFITTVTPIALCLDQRPRTVYPASAVLADQATPAPLRKVLTACLTRIRKVLPSAA